MGQMYFSQWDRHKPLGAKGRILQFESKMSPKDQLMDFEEVMDVLHD